MIDYEALLLGSIITMSLYVIVASIIYLKVIL